MSSSLSRLDGELLSNIPGVKLFVACHFLNLGALCNQEWWNSNVGIRRFRLNFQNGHLARAHENVDFVNSATPLEADELFLNWLISQSSGGLEPLDVVMTVDPLFTHPAVRPHSNSIVHVDVSGGVSEHPTVVDSGSISGSNDLIGRQMLRKLQLAECVSSHGLADYFENTVNHPVNFARKTAFLVVVNKVEMFRADPGLCSFFVLRSSVFGRLVACGAFFAILLS